MARRGKKEEKEPEIHAHAQSIKSAKPKDSKYDQL